MQPPWETPELTFQLTQKGYEIIFLLQICPPFQVLKGQQKEMKGKENRNATQTFNL